MLQINLTVLATAHAVSEGIVRGVNTEIQRRNIPNTYTATGQRAHARTAQHHSAGGQPLAVRDASNFNRIGAPASERHSARSLTPC